jgi:hypothetical protein
MDNRYTSKSATMDIVAPNTNAHPHGISLKDWAGMQKKILGWEVTAADSRVIDCVKDQGWNIDSSRTHHVLQHALSKHSVPKNQFDFFVMTDLELSKLPFDSVIKIIKAQLRSVKVGGYFALMSYYLNVTKPRRQLTGTYPENILQVFQQELADVAKVECVSNVYHEPINVFDPVSQEMIEGANFLFVHPNIRYFVWN